MSRVELVVLGEPIGKRRARYTLQNGIVRTYTPNITTHYESLITHEYNQKYGKLMFNQNIPVKVIITAYYGLNSSDYGKKGLNKSGREKIEKVYCTKKSDLDNICKSVLDALNSVCYFDDVQVVSITATKVYTLDSPRVEIIVEGLCEN